MSRKRETCGREWDGQTDTRSAERSTGTHRDVLIPYPLLLRQLNRRHRLTRRQAIRRQLGQQLRRPAARREDDNVRFEGAAIPQSHAAHVRPVGRVEERRGFAADALHAERAGEVEGGDDGIARSGPAADVVLVCVCVKVSTDLNENEGAGRHHAQAT